MAKQDDPIDSRILVDAIAEIKDMGRVGFSHPSLPPVAAGAAVGAVAGILLPILSTPVGLILGAAFMLYKRIRP